MKTRSSILTILFCLLQFAKGQDFKLMRYDEDYSYLKDSTKTFYNVLRYVPLSSNGNRFASFGGEGRLELDRAQNEDWGAKDIGSNTFLLQRYNFHINVHLGKRLRFFSQIRSGLEAGRKNGPRPIDEDQMNIQNLFIDLLPLKTANKSITLRIGRQELQYGSGRLIDVREGPNLRTYFDGVKLSYFSPSLKLDGLIMSDGRTRTGLLDNPGIDRINLWGIYSTFSPSPNFNLDLYYLGNRRLGSLYDEGIVSERRNTFGTRFWKSAGRLLYNFEIGYQTGSFEKGKIRAWGGSSELGYRFINLNGIPTVKLRGDFISGDQKKGDGELGTFSALYPNGGYFGMNPQAGPANLLSLHPTLSWKALKKLLLSTEVVLNWRQSEQDGIYRPDGSLSLSSSDSKKKYIGTAYIASLSFELNRFLNFNLGLQYFDTGNFINDVIPGHRDGFFATTVIGFKF
ncbi:hypothetical protein EG349_01110 [Chryseobacterium shandongense]|uniref:Alginate export domain-containing protein n=1 Tax=Chryseobacterium shandongense TaxID=1493872 RepID=A0AAD0YF21_9FLAO|nr:alginate export family protein [Chryseobacterium shandongense]AZA85486.1 hypothetical protein EG349_01110 [Chryseobacterium shandongense]AZA97593.1 hypothetical protein EG353_19580 [Chryseobacterium shandongense]